MLRLIRLFALLLILLLGGVWVFAWVNRQPQEAWGDSLLRSVSAIFGNAPVSAMGGVSLPQGLALGGAFTLVDQAGQTVTEQNYAGRWMLIYFGYSYCPDVCPTELGVMTTAIDQLGPAGEQVVPVFISVDPQRDTPAHLADYVSRFHPRLQGLSGSPEQVAEAARRYRVYFAKVQRPGMTDYLMDHSSFVYLVGPDGRVRSLFRPETTPEAIAAAVAAQLAGSARRS